MKLEKCTQYGNIVISKEVIASIAGGAATECYGVVGMASQRLLKDGLFEVLKIENYSKGIVLREVENDFAIDLYIVVGYGLKISEVVQEVQKKVKYVLEKNLGVKFDQVNIYVQDVRIVK